ncbi:conserved hypothetical protein [Sulfolobus islandicus Y.G.57.14]|jgi:hypothetical protein|uniref:Uncharacterized protein n=11 Tax=Saccharolobus islandicus TaxID=43080 RepID=M9UEJ8_SACIS|nr:hypothetical protein [Sulfolobus islandicus]ACP35801.1 conserved hypothetical protein [Sulfolobus islandicus L.S.2.15]ACP38426.1 conserved hypothetical protein [Sulfolobus islandicus M.14.25]ACP46050.1 conserved hypothetical protein [Sulfolobus islandicus Y.G.57.14]ACP48239.1 conserved hypothetical protein [Sulfolobus islandicus Y.N.15.51]ACP55668.1 conserved hypothetical protein [Sulfolobus islandicus M.16.27]
MIVMRVKVNEKQFDMIIDKLKLMVYEYNTKIKEYGVYLKPYHIVYKNSKRYIYIGKYWYKLEKIGGKLKWIYLGKTKPIQNMPNPPQIPESTIIKEDNEYIVDEKILYDLE